MANGWPDDHDSVGDDLEAIELSTDEPTSRAEPETGDKDRPPRRRGLLVLALAAVVVAIVGVSVAVSRDDGDAEAEPGNRGTSSASRTVPDATIIPPEERPPPTTPGDASTTAPLLPEGAPSTPDIGELVASVTNFYGGGSGGASPPFGAYYLYADGRLISASDPAAEDPEFVEQRLTPEGVARVRNVVLTAGLFDPNPAPGNISDCTYGMCVRGNDGRLLTTPASARTRAPAARLVANLGTLDESLPDTEWAARRIRTYIPPRIAVCLQTFANVPDRAIQVPLDLSIVVPTFPARAAELLVGHEPIGARPNPDPACFEMTLDEARTLADEFLGPAGGGSHQYSGIVIRNRQLAAIRTSATQGIVAYLRFNTLLPHRESAAAFGG